MVEHGQGRHLIGECELDVNKHRFLQDHTFFGRDLSVYDPTLRALSIMPLAMTLEMMAEAVVMVFQLREAYILDLEAPRVQ